MTYRAGVLIVHSFPFFPPAILHYVAFSCGTLILLLLFRFFWCFFSYDYSVATLLVYSVMIFVCQRESMCRSISVPITAVA